VIQTRPNQTIVNRSLETLLMAQVAEQDSAAFACVYEATFARVLGVIRGLARRAEDAEEVLCEVYLDAWCRAGEYDPKRGSVADWLVSAARRRALDRLRRSRPAAVAAAASPSERRAPSNQSETASTRHQVTRKLTEECAELPIGAVKSMIRRSLAGLQPALGLDPG
jgi:RNA polymerase sigma-70 factor (ECF subfamily)